MKQLLQVNNLNISFPTPSATVTVVDGVSFSIAEGEIVALVGESGSGKSITAQAIARLMASPPAVVSGEILFDGVNILACAETELRQVRKNMGIIFQNPAASLNPVLTVGQQIVETIKTHCPVSSANARERALQMLRLVDIPSPATRLKQYPHELSGGTCQRIMIAMALSCNPRLLIADEPTTSLDVTIQADVLSLFKKLRLDNKLSILFITHNLSIVAGLADKIMVMYAGKILETAPVKELYANPQHPYTIGLLNSIPGLHQDRSAKLNTIEGDSPGLHPQYRGCPFFNRCQFVMDTCLSLMPSYTEVSPGHITACWLRHPYMRKTASMTRKEAAAGEQ